MANAEFRSFPHPHFFFKNANVVCGLFLKVIVDSQSAHAHSKVGHSFVRFGKRLCLLASESCSDACSRDRVKPGVANVLLSCSDACSRDRVKPGVANVLLSCSDACLRDRVKQLQPRVRTYMGIPGVLLMCC
jgi:hypothetical protein